MKKILFVLLLCLIINISYADLDRIVSKEFWGYDVLDIINEKYNIEDAKAIYTKEHLLTRRAYASIIVVYLNEIERMYNINGYVEVELQYLVKLEELILEFSEEIETLYSDNIGTLTPKITLLETQIAQKSEMMGVLKPHVNYKKKETSHLSFDNNLNKTEKKKDVKKEITTLIEDLKVKNVQETEKNIKIKTNKFDPEFYARVNFNAVDLPIKFVLDALLEKTSLSLFIDNDAQKNITVQLKDMQLIDAIAKISESADCVYEINKKNIMIESKNSIREKVFKVKYIALDKAVAFINKIKSPKGKVISNTINNSIIVYDTVSSIKKIDANMREIDVEGSIAQVLTVVRTLEYADVNDIVNLLNPIKSEEGRLTPNIKSNSVIITDRKKNITEMDDLIKKMDMPNFETRQTTYIYNVKYSSATEILTILQSEAFAGSIAKGVKLTSDTRTNSIVLTGNKETINKVLQYVDQLDIRTKQVTIMAKIIEVTLDNNNSNGLNWSMLAPYGAKDKSVDEENKITINTFDSLGADKTAIRFGTLAKEQLEVLYEQLSSESNAKVISNPTITTLDNQEARILIGEKIPFEETTTTDGNTSSTINFKDVGITLTVVPKISPDNYITLKVHPEISEQKGTTTKGEPILGTTEADTNVIVKNGETLVIGGLIKNNKVVSVNRVPLLGRIGIFKNMFRSERITNKRTETIVLITPHVIDDYRRNNSIYVNKYQNINKNEVLYE